MKFTLGDVAALNAERIDAERMARPLTDDPEEAVAERAALLEELRGLERAVTASAKSPERARKVKLAQAIMARRRVLGTMLAERGQALVSTIDPEEIEPVELVGRLCSELHRTDPRPEALALLALAGVAFGRLMTSPTHDGALRRFVDRWRTQHQSAIVIWVGADNVQTRVDPGTNIPYADASKATRAPTATAVDWDFTTYNLADLCAAEERAANPMIECIVPSQVSDAYAEMLRKATDDLCRSQAVPPPFVPASVHMESAPRCPSCDSAAHLRKTENGWYCGGTCGGWHGASLTAPPAVPRFAVGDWVRARSSGDVGQVMRASVVSYGVVYDLATHDDDPEQNEGRSFTHDEDDLIAAERPR